MLNPLILLQRLLLLGLLCWAVDGVGLRADVNVIPGSGSDSNKSDKKRAKELEELRERLAQMVPEVKPASVSFVAGRSVDIELEAATAEVRGLKFIVREQPQHGQLSNLRAHPTAPHKAIVTYTHTNLDQLVDRFTYSCRIGNSAYAAAGTVSLMGRAAAPKLEVLRQPMFDKVLPGVMTETRAVVRNAGIGPFRSALRWPSPWSGPAEVAIGVGETVEIPIQVSTSKPGVLSEELVLQPENELSRLRLWLQCEQPFMVSPNRAQMEFDAERGVRFMKTKVANVTEQTLTLKVIRPERLEGPSSVEVKPGVLTEVEFHLQDEDVESFRGEVLFTDGVLGETLVLGASPEPAQIRLQEPTDGVLDFGNLPQGEPATRRIVVGNEGGTTAILAVQVPPPFEMAEQEEALSVGPGATQSLALSVVSSKPGRFDESMVITGQARRLEMTLKAAFVDPAVAKMTRPESPKGKAAGVARPAATGRPKAVKPVAVEQERPVATKKAEPRPVSAPRRPVFEEQEGGLLSRLDPKLAGMVSYMSVFGAPIPPEMRSAKLEAIGDFGVTDQGRTHVQIMWETPPAERLPQSYLVQQSIQRYSPELRMYFRDWQSIAAEEITDRKRGWSGIRLEGLEAGAQYELRFLGVDELGKLSEPSNIIMVTMDPPFRLPGWVWTLLVLLLISAVLGGVKQVQTRRWAEA